MIKTLISLSIYFCFQAGYSQKISIVTKDKRIINTVVTTSTNSTLITESGKFLYSDIYTAQFTARQEDDIAIYKKLETAGVHVVFSGNPIVLDDGVKEPTISAPFVRNPLEPNLQYAQVTALESQISGGMGRSRLIVTFPDGKQVNSELQNYKSMTGINFENALNNERAITLAINKMTEQGFEIRWVESGVSEGIYITKYIMVRKEQ